MTRQSTVSFRDNIYKMIIDLQSELVKSTGTTWGTSQIINLLCFFAIKKGITVKELEKLKKGLD
jgi:hypothetical protein